MPIQTINPTTGDVIQTYELLTKDQLNQTIDVANTAFKAWRFTEWEKRKMLMLALAALLRQKQDEFSRLMAMEMGKPITAGKAEIEKCAWVCEHYAEHAKRYLAPRVIPNSMSKTKVSYQPLGVVFAIMPWNFPFWQVFRFAAPTLMAGNAALLKHAPISTGTGNAIAALFLEAGFPAGLFQHMILDNDMAAEVIAHDQVVGVSLTGSEKAGAAVASLAAKHIKKAVLELGGNDPYLVLADADIDLAARAIVTSRLSNTGQVCIAAKRIIADATIELKLVEKIQEVMTQFKPGDPLDPATNFGPMARKDLRDTLQQQVSQSIAKGATCLQGGEIPEGNGYYYPPTLLINVQPGMPAFDEELFGPVIAIIRADNEAESIALANQSRYGLGAAVFTQDLVRGEYIATTQIEAGSCFVNVPVASDPRVPFGGIKHSGFGRELSQEGILEFVNVKTVSIQ